MDFATFEALAAHASESVLAFAAFAASSEDIALGAEENHARLHYERSWFELEIVNATALTEWEADGCPADWIEKWTQRFRQDAVETSGLLTDAARALLL